MNVRYTVDIEGIHIFTNKPLFVEPDETTKAFLGLLELARGVDEVNVFRHRVILKVGLLFSTTDTLEDLEKIFREFYQINTWAPLSTSDYEHRILSDINANAGYDVQQMLALNADLKEA